MSELHVAQPMKHCLRERQIIRVGKGGVAAAACEIVRIVTCLVSGRDHVHLEAL